MIRVARKLTMNIGTPSAHCGAIKLRLIVAIFIIALLEPAVAQPHGQWAWISGSSAVPGSYSGQRGVYGTEYQFAAANTPGGRYSSAFWSGSAGRLWLFGGTGNDSAGNAGLLNDLWVFDPGQGAHGEWAWMGGSKTKPASCGFCGPTGVYGPEYQFSAGNIPGARTWAAQWVDQNGRFWLFGGYGVDASGKVGFLNDLWVFDPAQGAHGEWAWMGGGTLGNLPGVYVSLHQFAPAQIPSGRAAPVTWSSQSGQLWLFGGEDSSSSGNAECRNDVWEFDPAQGAHGEWAWMGGNSTVDAGGGQAGFYGIEGQFSSSNIPAGRWAASSWTGPDGRVWMFGGEGYGSPGTFGWFSDLWVFDPSQGAYGEWAWMGGGSNRINQAGVYGDEAQFAAANVPGGRNEASSWVDPTGKLWLFGGNGLDSTGTGDYLNDLWVFDPSQGANGEWAWVGGSRTTGPNYDRPGDYGAKYQLADANAPGGRAGAAAWTGQNGQAWLFGGFGADGAGNQGNLNDLWQYVIDANQPQTIAFTPLVSPVTYSLKPIVLSATASSGLPVAFSIVSGPAKFVKSSKPTIVVTAPGTVVVAADQPGSVTYAAASEVTQTIAVNPAPLTVEASSLTMTYGTPFPALKWIAAGFVPGDTIANSLTGQPALATTGTSSSLPGSYAITIGPGTLASAKYSFRFFNATLKVLPLGTVAMPSIQPAGGNHTGAQSVTITDTTDGATIYYTTNGSTPSATHGTAYTGAFTLSKSATVKAIAVEPGWTNSGIASATYTNH
jgi:N-acetylneuraminic acid mutarotase